jgi:hypothetical protein
MITKPEEATIVSRLNLSSSLFPTSYEGLQKETDICEEEILLKGEWIQESTQNPPSLNSDTDCACE